MSVGPEWGNFMRRLVPGALLASALSAGLAMFGMAPAGAAAVSIATGQAGPVTANPANTPQLNANGSVEQVRQLVQCGGTMYAVGTFTSIKHNSTVYTRNNVVQLQRDRPVQRHLLGPERQRDRQLDRLQRQQLRRCLHRRQVHRGQRHQGRATSPRSTPPPAPWSPPSGTPPTARSRRCSESSGHILAGGYYTTINGSTNKYMTSLNPTTGKDDGFISLNISGNYHFPGAGQ